jgi:thioesterase domain-containing protein
MEIVKLIEELKGKGIQLSYSEGKLKYTGMEEYITPDLIGKLRKHKRELIEYFLPNEFSNILFFNIGGTKTPIFLIHGDNFNYSFSDYLGPDQPVYGFFHPGSNGEVIPYKNVAQMAKAYLDKVLSLNPVGPYYLIGFSFGGLLAFEMAVQLQKLGYEVPLLVLIDCINPLAMMSEKRQSFFIRILKRKYLDHLRWRLELFVKLLICKSYILTKTPIPIKIRKYYILEKYRKLTKRYNPDKFNGDMLLFRFSENGSSLKYLGWESFVNNLKMITIDSNHITAFENKRSVEILQTEIKQYLKNLSNNIS